MKVVADSCTRGPEGAGARSAAAPRASAPALRLPILSLLLATLTVPIAAGAAEDAHQWLVKMARAGRSLDYEGTFVYRHDAQLDTLRIVHKVTDGVAHERLMSLNGVPREIVRDAREVRSYYPNDNAVVVEQRRADDQTFPSLLPERVQNLNENYIIQLGKSGRVADRPVQQVLVRPRDSYRYGYRLWADRDSGLLLKADLMDEADRILEQFLFIQVAIGGNIPASALAPQTARPDMVWHRDTSEITRDVETSWIATRLPKGFQLTKQMKRELPTRRKPVEHLVYSDGLAAVSVFVEKSEDGNLVTQGASRTGAVNAYGRPADGHYVTTVGEVPAATVSLIGDSVARR
jgi:sigma-E factor negative regulatory protein RseB